jgi:hypothetical protein
MEDVTAVAARAFRDEKIGEFFQCLTDLVKLAMPLVAATVEELKKEQAAKRRHI